MFCAACGLARDPSDLIAYWPVGRPAARRFVCRPTKPSPRTSESCFRVVVGPATVHEISFAHAALEPRQAASWVPVPA